MATLKATSATRLGAPPSSTKAVAQPLAAPSAGSQVAKAVGQVFNTPGDVRQQLEKVVAQGGPAAAAQARTLLQQLDANPNLATDPGFKQAVGAVWQQASIANAPGLIQNSGLGSTVNSNATKAVQGVVNTQNQAASDAKRADLGQQSLDLAKSDRAENLGFFDTNVTPLLAGQRQAAQGASTADLIALQQQSEARDRANAAQQAAIAQQTANANKYNAGATQRYNDYSTGQNALNTQDQGTLANYLNETNPLMTQLRASSSNPGDVAAQQAALQRAIGIAGGSLDYQAAQASYQGYNAAQADYRGYNAAQAASNPYDLERQQRGYDQLDAIGLGKLDYNSQAAQAYTDPQDLANQRRAMQDIQNEVEFGGKDQRDALDLIKSRTGVTPTGEEAFLYELNRRAREAQDKSSRDATLERLAGQGLRSGGAEIAMQQVGGQQRAQDRLLADLAANANAVKRAQAYTGMQADQSNAMRNSLQNALNMQNSLSSTMRGQSFDEAYKRGLGADQASANNQGTRLAGYQGAANTANIMRGQGDNMAMFNTGQTNDAQRFTANAFNENSMFNTGQTNNARAFTANAYNTNSMFNAGQTNNAYANNQATRLGGAGLQASQSNAIRSANDTMLMHQDNFANAEAQRVGNLAGQRATTGLATTSQIGGRNTTTYNGGVDLDANNYARDRDTVTDMTGAIQPTYGRDTDVNNTLAAAGDRNFQRATTLVNSGTSAASGRAGASNPSLLLNALGVQLGGTVFDEDQRALRGY